MATILVVLAVGAALLIGALWGLYGKLPGRVEGFVIALAGGALVLSLVSELIEPSIERSNMLVAIAGIAAGAVVFTGVDYLIDETWGESSGGGLLAAITLDGVPENLALGVALISASPLEVSALAASIFLSNLPEAAGGAKEMAESGHSRSKILLLWVATAALLSAAAMAGRYLLAGASPHFLAFVSCFAAGAVVASLSTEVFPKAYREGRHLAGIATALGFVLAFVLETLGGG